MFDTFFQELLLTDFPKYMVMNDALRHAREVNKRVCGGEEEGGKGGALFTVRKMIVSLFHKS